MSSNAKDDKEVKLVDDEAMSDDSEPSVDGDSHEPSDGESIDGDKKKKDGSDEESDSDGSESSSGSSEDDHARAQCKFIDDAAGGSDEDRGDKEYIKELKAIAKSNTKGVNKVPHHDQDEIDRLLGKEENDGYEKDSFLATDEDELSEGERKRRRKREKRAVKRELKSQSAVLNHAAKLKSKPASDIESSSEDESARKKKDKKRKRVIADEDQPEEEQEEQQDLEVGSEFDITAMKTLQQEDTTDEKVERKTAAYHEYNGKKDKNTPATGGSATTKTSNNNPPKSPAKSKAKPAVKRKSSKPTYQAGEVFQIGTQAYRVTYRGIDSPLIMQNNGKSIIDPDAYNPDAWTTAQPVTLDEASGEWKVSGEHLHFQTAKDRKPTKVNPRYEEHGWYNSPKLELDDKVNYANEAIRCKNRLLSEDERGHPTVRLMFEQALYERVLREAKRPEGKTFWSVEHVAGDAMEAPKVELDVDGEPIRKGSTTPKKGSEKKPPSAKKAKLEQKPEKGCKDLKAMMEKKQPVTVKTEPASTSAPTTSFGNDVDEMMAELFDAPPAKVKSEPISDPHLYGYTEIELFLKVLATKHAKSKSPQDLAAFYKNVQKDWQAALSIKDSDQERLSKVGALIAKKPLYALMGCAPFLNPSIAEYVRNYTKQ